MRKLALLGALLAVAVNGCSKTQDTAPETRLFGDPPVISSVDFTSSQEPLNCDLTDFAKGFLCLIDGSLPSDAWTFQAPPIVFHLGYTNILMDVRASDPNSTPSENDLLLVGASYVHQGEETTLLVFDDGSEFEFPKGQQSQWDDGCTSTTNKPGDAFCSVCPRGNFTLTSNDAAKNDGLYTRGYAFFRVGGTQRGWLSEDCISRELHRAPVSASGLEGTTIQFKIEAVDRSGNITTWPQEYSALIQASSTSCTGDDCMCCLLTADNQEGECRGKEGTVGPPPYDQGLCKTF